MGAVDKKVNEAGRKIWEELEGLPGGRSCAARHRRCLNENTLYHICIVCQGLPVSVLFTEGLAGVPEHKERILYSACAAATPFCEGRNGRTEKNLCRHDTQRSAGKSRMRPKKDIAPGTRSAEMRCKLRLPQIWQCA